jgi:hypothetical protein
MKLWNGAGAMVEVVGYPERRRPKWGRQVRMVGAGRGFWFSSGGENRPQGRGLDPVERRKESSMSQLPTPSVIAVASDRPEDGLVRRQVGTMVEVWAPGVYEVAFSDDWGKPSALVAPRDEQPLQLHHAFVPEAAKADEE